MKKITFNFICFMFLLVSFPLVSEAAEGFEFIEPSPGTSYNAGDPVTIRWTQGDTSMLNVQWLDYSYTCGSSTCYNRINYDLAPTETSYTWQIPSHVSGDIGFRLYTCCIPTGDSSISKGLYIESEKIRINTVGSLTVISPRQGDVFTTDDSVEVLFDLDAGINSNAAKYDLYKGKSLVEKNIYISGTKKWWVKENYQESSNYRIKVTVGTLEAYSGYFTIKPTETSVISISSPYENQVLKIGNTYTIDWDVDENYRRVEIWLDVGEGDNGLRRVLPITPFAFDAMSFNSIFNWNTGSFSWNVPSSIAVSSVNFGGNSYSYIIHLDPNDGSFQTSVIQAPVQPTILLEPPYEITPGQYRIYISLTNTGSVLSSSIFSDYFTISETNSFEEPSLPINSIQGLIGLNELQSFITPTTNNPLGLRSNWLIKNKEFAEVFWADEDYCLHWIINEEIAEKNFGVIWNYEGTIKEFDEIPPGYSFCDNLE